MEEKTLPRGFSFTLDKSNRDRVFVQQIARDKEVVRLTVTGPAAKKVELETLAGHLSATLEVPETRHSRPARNSAVVTPKVSAPGVTTTSSVAS